jgi:protein TonB
MSKRLNLTLLLVLLSLGAVSADASVPRDARALRLGSALAALDAAATEREQDGLSGPVRRVKTETAKINVKGGRPVEGAREVLETTTYDQKGNRVDNAYFLAAGGSLTGKEVYKYDERGNIVEMTLHNDDGTLLAKEVYTYEFDAVGNWVKMTTSVAVMEGGKVTFEPSEVTYRTISYYLDQNVLAKMSQPAATTTQSPAPSNSAPANTAPNTVAANSQPQPVSKPQTPAVNNTTAAQPKSSNADAKSAPARNTAAPLLVASLDRGSATSAPAPAASSANIPLAEGPAVKSDGDAPAPAAMPVRSGPLKPISGGVLNGKAISLPAPSYPEIARRAGASGVVEVEVVIDLTGKVISAKATSGPPLLRQAAEMAARLARFNPTLLSGQPMRVSGVISYNFTLQR